MVTPLGSFQISREDIREGSQWRRSYIPTIGTHTISKKHGERIVKGVQTRPKMKPMYEHIMSASLQQIRSREVYHIVFAWHLYQHASISSESLAESVGSFLKYFHISNVHGNLSTKQIAWATQLRAANVRGSGEEHGLMAMALNVHFDSEGPSGWHFVAKRPANGGRHSKEQQPQQDWVSSHLLDVLRARRMILCKKPPLSLRSLLDVSRARRRRPGAAAA